jgi:hypothetical protein
MDDNIHKMCLVFRGQRICDKCRKNVENLSEHFGNEALISSSSKYDIS